MSFRGASRQFCFLSQTSHLPMCQVFMLSCLAASCSLIFTTQTSQSSHQASCRKKEANKTRFPKGQTNSKALIYFTYFKTLSNSPSVQECVL